MESPPEHEKADARLLIAMGHLSHESNSFSPLPTPLSRFAPLAVGPVEVGSVADRFPSLRGFAEANTSDWNLHGLIAAEAMPSGPIEDAAADELCRTVLTELLAVPGCSGVLFFLHGAMLTQDGRSLDVEICKTLRATVGDQVPIVLVMDLHGNISSALGDLVQGVFAYQTNPHVDEFERAVDAANLLEHLLSTDTTAFVDVAKPKVLLPTVRMLTASDPMSEIEGSARATETRPEVLAVSVFGGWPLADTESAGPSVVVTSSYRGVGRREADRLAKLFEENREEFLPRLVSLTQILNRPPRGLGPVVVADVADNPGGGGPADTTDVLRFLVESNAAGALGCIWDPSLVAQVQSQLGQQVHVPVGGHCCPELYGAPVWVTATVAAATDGRFQAEGSVLDHGIVECGPTIRLDIGQLRVVVTTVRHPANDRGFFRQVGINPEDEPLLVVKSRGHFRAEFEPIAAEILEVDARGPTHPDLRKYQFTKVNRPVWPLDDD